MKKINNKDLLKSKYNMKDIYTSLTEDKKNAQDYPNLIIKEVENFLNNNIIIPKFERNLCMDNSQKIVQKLQLNQQMVKTLQELLRRISLYKCNEKFHIEIDDLISISEKNKLKNTLDKLFREINKRIKKAINVLNLEIQLEEQSISNRTFTKTPVTINGSYKDGVKNLRNEIENNVKSIICNTDSISVETIAI